MNLINLIMQTAKTDTYHKGEASELAIHLWSTANKEQHILIDNLFVKLIGKPLSELVQKVDSVSYMKSMKRIASEERHSESKIQIIWQIDDVKSVRPGLNDQQCMEVLREVKRWHDASVGVNWDVLEYMSDYLFPVKQSIKI